MFQMRFQRVCDAFEVRCVLGAFEVRLSHREDAENTERRIFVWLF